MEKIPSAEEPFSSGFEIGDHARAVLQVLQNEEWVDVDQFDGRICGSAELTHKNQGVNFLPNEPLPRGHEYATGAPFFITGNSFTEDIAGRGKVCFRFQVSPLRPNLDS